MQRQRLTLSWVIGLALTSAAVVWLIISLWLLRGASHSVPKLAADGSTYIACGSVFDLPDWPSHLLVHHFALPLGILAAGVGMIRYCTLNSGSQPNS